MKLHLPSNTQVTLVENIFIDQYMPKANGEFVKLYLYLLRCANSEKELSLSSIADTFDHTEKDVRRALSYWEKLNLLKLQYDKDGHLCDIVFLNGAPQEETAAAKSPAPAKASSVLTRDRKKELKEQEQIRQLMFVAEQYYSRPLTSTEQSAILYFYDTLHFSADLIEYLIEYCVSKGSGSIHYMEKVAQEWYKNGITTVAQAKSSTNLYNKNYFTIFNAMGIKGRNPAPAEIEIMNRWFQDYDFTIEIILEACCRTIRQTHQPNFQYAGKILEHWHKAGVHHLKDIQVLDQQHLEKQAQTVRQTEKQPTRSSAPNRFNNFTQREYDWTQLEKQLLNAQEKEG